MRTPAGAECALYYEDFARGRNVQQCRAARQTGSATWRPEDCAACPVPAVLAANGSPWLAVTIRIPNKRFRTRRRVTATFACSLHGVSLADPNIGCPRCNAEADDLLRAAFE